jgi:hypothetical protein
MQVKTGNKDWVPMKEKGEQKDWVTMQNDWVPMMEDGVPMQRHTGVFLDLESVLD